MANIKDATGATKIGLLLASIGLLLHIIGFATTNWYEDGSHHVGLWSNCYGNICDDYFYKSGGFEATEAFETIGLILGILTVGAFLYWCFVEDVPPKSSLNTGIVFGLASAAISIFIGAMIFGIDVIPYGSSGGSSFILSIVGGVGLALGAIPTAMELNSRSSEEDNERQPLRNNDANQQNPDCKSDGSTASSHPGNTNTQGNSNTFPSGAAYSNEKRALPDMSYNSVEKQGPPGWTPQPQPRDGDYKTSSTNGKLFDSASVSQDENDLLSTLPGAVDPAVSKTDDSKSMEIKNAGRGANNSMLYKVL